MTLAHRLLLLTAVAAALATALVARGAAARALPGSSRAAPWITSCLLLVAGALIGVGIVSETLLRHVIQVAPLLLGAGVAAIRPASAASVAAPLFAFWLSIVGAIWLFLLGVARIVTGTFAPAEIFLTIVIGAACIVGLGVSRRRRATVPMVAQLAAIAGFAALQFAALWLSVQPLVAGR